MKNILRLSRYLPQLSGFIALIAITFDVGYFTAIDINFFTFFSLPEHLLFAIEALPLAFVVVGMTVAQFFFIERMVGSFNKHFGGRSSVAATRIVYGLAFAALGCFVWYFWDDFTKEVLVVAIIVVIPISMLAFEVVLHSGTWSTYLFFALPLSFLIAFGIGYGIAGAYANLNYDPEYFHQITSQKGINKGRVIRSGEKGILYIEFSAGEIIYEKWENIERISGTRRFGRRF